jgi:hypothetical protein
MTVYRCLDVVDGGEPMWHFGHVGAAVRQGFVARGDRYGRRAS